MNPEKQRIAIATACKKYGQKWMVVNPNIHTLPDYLNDLNAMQEAEKLFDGEQWRIFLGFLAEAVGVERPIPRLMSLDDFHKCWFSTAAQHAKAFLWTIGKWEDDK